MKIESMLHDFHLVNDLKVLHLSLCILTLSIFFTFEGGCTNPSSTPSSSVSPANIADCVDSLLSPLVLDGILSGSVLIAHEERIVFSKGYGTADREHGTLNTPSTIFRIGSITKPITAIGIMKLREIGKLELDAPLSMYLPDLPNADIITIRHLLNHTSGLPSFDWRRSNNRPQELNRVIDWIRELHPISAPGEQFQYSNSGYALLAHIIEILSGMDYIEFIRESILDPCGMHNTGLYSMDRPPDGLALGYSRIEYGDFSVSDRPSPLGRGPGDLYSTVLDLYQLSRNVFNGELLSPGSRSHMLMPGKGSYGLGWYISELHGEKVVYHPGGLLGYMASLQCFPERKITVISLFNSDFLLAHIVERELVAIALGKPWRPILHNSDALNKAQFGRFVGDYTIDSSSTFSLSLEGGHLYFQESSRPKCIAYPYSDNGIYVKEINTRIIFEESNDGEIHYTGFFGVFMVTGQRYTLPLKRKPQDVF